MQRVERSQRNWGCQTGLLIGLGALLLRLLVGLHGYSGTTHLQSIIKCVYSPPASLYRPVSLGIRCMQLCTIQCLTGTWIQSFARSAVPILI